ncbi:lysophospholipase [Mycoplasma sp. CSL7475-4]|uniref:lysophospholipase n=1 Tax=Mycoplasma sp. CSL7475-4 TaxID=2973942 RepID=UPI00216AC28A|nr:lysophospholipase [Mycoplasma sp. CSL7475-4]MCS4537205.1 lysophospholipase [Mycoplasma sp. CSL7475-4]
MMKNEINEFVIKSSIDRAQLVCYDFAPQTNKPKIIVQLCHGMMEHALRYSELAQFLSNKDIKVVGMDNRGHGKTGVKTGVLGHIDDQDGARKLINDMHDLYQFWHNKYPEAKYVIFGHSMGSIILRNYLILYSKSLSAAIISGTSGLAGLKEKLGLYIAQKFVQNEGANSYNRFINNLVLKNVNKRVKNPQTKFDWLTSDQSEIDKFMNDDLCGFLCTNSFYVDLARLAINMGNKKYRALLNKDLKMFFIAGEDDPIGKYGKGVIKSAKYYKSAKLKHVEVKIYKKMRHEIHNEINKNIVFEDLKTYLESLI